MFAYNIFYLNQQDCKPITDSTKLELVKKRVLYILQIGERGPLIYVFFSFSFVIGTPDNVNGDENCMLLIYDGNSNSVFWNDGTCHMPLNYICETEDT